ncbi:MAG: hypothetical protein R3B45_04545 [Bdellovibrionota bacterium]
MTFRVGDAVFARRGEPAVVVERDKVRDRLSVDASKQAVEKNHRHGYINGLQQHERDEFLSVMDKIAEIEDPKEKMDALNQRITQAKSDPKQLHLISYLESELFHVMNTYGIHPKQYTIWQRS